MLNFSAFAFKKTLKIENSTYNLKQNLKLMNDTLGNIAIAKPTGIVKMSYNFLNLDMQSVI